MRACFTYSLAKGRLLEREFEVAGDLPDGAVTNPTKTHHLRLELGVAAVGVSTEAGDDKAASPPAMGTPAPSRRPVH